VPRQWTVLTLLYRVERYNALTSNGEAQGSASVQPSPATAGVASMPEPAVLGQRGSQISLPGLASKKTRSHIDLGVGIVETPMGSQSDILSGGMVASPLTAGPSSGVEEEPHLSGHEPRYWPGVVTRGQRRMSTRQGSAHEGDAPVDGVKRRQDGPAV
jgi:AMP deaminase